VKKMEIKWTLFVAVLGLLVLSGIASADEHRVDSFVCPVFNPESQAGAKTPNAFGIGGGDTSIKPGNAFTHPDGPVSVPEGATNQDGDGTPPGTHAGPGDEGYTAIWKTP
jgi:hypothetical protein